MATDSRSLVLEAETSCLHQAMEFVRKGALEASLPEVRLGQLDLLIEEIFINVCRYAYRDRTPGKVTLSYWITPPAELNVEVADRGDEFNLLAAEPPNLAEDLDNRPIGGLGIFLVKKLATSLNYRREDGWNRLTFGISANA